MEVIFSPTVPKIQPNLWLDSNSVLHAPTNNGWKEISNGESSGSNGDAIVLDLDNVLSTAEADASLYKKFKPMLLSKDPVKVFGTTVIGFHISSTSEEPHVVETDYAQYGFPSAEYSEYEEFSGWRIDYGVKPLSFDASYLVSQRAIACGKIEVFTDEQLDVLYELQKQAVELSVEGMNIDPGAVLYSTEGEDAENECSDNTFYGVQVVSDDNFEVEGQPYAYQYKFIVDIYTPEEPADAKGKKEQTREAEDKQYCIIKDVVKTDTQVLIDGVLQLPLEDAKKLIGIWGEYSRSPKE